MRIANIVFREISDISDPLYKDASVVLIVSDDYRIVDRVQRYREEGIKPAVYPLNILDSPNLLSLLGVCAWLHENSLQGSVVVEGYGQQRLLEKAYQVVFLGMEVDEIMLQDLVSPLHVRSLIHLYGLRIGGIDIANEAKNFVRDAFTGGDAHKSTVLELGIDIITQLGKVSDALSNCISHLYDTVVHGKSHRASKTCRLVHEASELLDYLNNGAVKSLALVGEDNRVSILVGCKLFLSDEECWPEINNARDVLVRLLNELGLVLGDIGMVRPEEAACIAYGNYASGVCGDED